MSDNIKLNAWEAAEEIVNLRRENAALRDLTSTLGAPNHINVPVEQWHELRADVYQCPPTSENDYDGFKWRDACEELEVEIAELRADKQRLDWLLTDDGGYWVNWMYDKNEWTPELKASRDAIDSCRSGRIGREKP